jgi:hypothetical protein
MKRTQWRGCKKNSFELIPPDGAEIIRVSIAGRSLDEQAALVNAVVHAYVNEVRDLERHGRSNRLSQLTQLKTRYDETLAG